MATVTDLYLFRQLRRVDHLFSLLDEEWPSECRRAWFDGRAAHVFGLVWPGDPDPLPAKAPGITWDDLFRPALLCVDEDLAARLTDIGFLDANLLVEVRRDGRHGEDA